MYNAEAGRLANVRVEKQMRKYLKKWGHSQAKRETNKVQKFDINSLSISNQISSFRNKGDENKIKQGSVIFNSSHALRLPSHKRNFDLSDKESNSSVATEEMMMSESENEVFPNNECILG